MYRKDKPSHRPDACRIHGTLVVNKVAGNFHITAGKYVMNDDVKYQFFPVNNYNINKANIGIPFKICIFIFTKKKYFVKKKSIIQIQMKYW